MVLARIVVGNVRPSTPFGYPAKAVVGEKVRVSADIFKDGHDVLAAQVRWRPVDDGEWMASPVRDLGNDRWETVVEPTALGCHELVVEAWTGQICNLAGEGDHEARRRAGHRRRSGGRCSAVRVGCH